MAERLAILQGRTLVATAAVAGLDCAWLYILFDVVNQGLHLDVPVPTLFLIYAASWAWMIALRAMIRSSAVRATLLWIAWPPATFLLLLGSLDGLTGITHAIEEAVFMVLAAGLLWWIGGLRGRSHATYESVLIGFQFGLMMLLASFLIGYAVHADLSAAIPTAVVFVGLGLIAAAVTRTDEKGTPSFVRRSGTWWAMLLVSLTLVLLLGLLAGVLFTPELMHLVGRGLRGLWGLVERLFGLLAGLFSPSNSGSLPSPDPVSTMPQEPEPGFTLRMPDWLRRSFAIGVTVVFAGMILLAIWRTASRLFARMRRAREGRGEMEPLRGAFREDVMGVLRRVFAWLAGLLALGRNRTQPDESPQTASIRRLYAEMLRWGAGSGFPRGVSQTPLEYQEILCVALPGHEMEVRSITESYVRAKYGAQPPTEIELQQLRESRRRLKRRSVRERDRRRAGQR